MAKNNMWVIIIVAAVALLAFGVIKLPSGQSTVPTPTPGVPTSAGCSQNPAYTYGGVDNFAQGTAVTTNAVTYIKEDGNAPVTTLAAPQVGNSLQFWLGNSTYFCPPVSDIVVCGAKSLQTKCYSNSTTLSVNVWDTDNGNVALTSGGGATNFTMGANAVQNFEIKYKTLAKKANMPFGGCLAVEVPSTITTVTLTGEGITSGCPYAWTYTTQSTSNTYKLFTVPAGFDTDGTGIQKTISGQMKAGSSDPSGLFYVTFAPANYYVTNDGQFAIGIEKDKNDDTTKAYTGPGRYTFSIT